MPKLQRLIMMMTMGNGLHLLCYLFAGKPGTSIARTDQEGALPPRGTPWTHTLWDTTALPIAILFPHVFMFHVSCCYDMDIIVGVIILTLDTLH